MKQINIYFMMSLIMLIMVVILILISVAFLTLMERKFLSNIQLRKGPNKIGYLGIIQPFSDALKLLSKETYFMIKMNFIYYIISPIFMLLMILMMWLIYPFYSILISMELGVIYLLCCFSLSVYGFLMTGWSSNSIYAMLGSVRSLSQSISYEVSLSIIILSFILLIESFNLNNFIYFQKNLWFMILLLPSSLIFFFSLMAELNRTPFDFSEGESELVSGFNVEYMSSGFVLIFLSEYASILFLSFLYTMFFMGGNSGSLIFYINLMSIVYHVIWIRGSLPRFRYDLLMYFCWLVILPFILNYFYYMILIKMLI